MESPDRYRRPTDAESSGCAYTTSTVIIGIGALLVMIPFLALHRHDLALNALGRWVLVAFAGIGTIVNAIGLQFHAAAISLGRRVSGRPMLALSFRIGSAVIGIGLLWAYLVIVGLVRIDQLTEPPVITAALLALNAIMTALHYFEIAWKGGRS